MRLLSASHLSNLLLGVFALRDGTVACHRKFSLCDRKSAGQFFLGFSHLMHSVKASEVGRGKGAVTFAGGRFADKKCRLCFCSVGLKSVQQQDKEEEESV